MKMLKQLKSSVILQGNVSDKIITFSDPGTTQRKSCDRDIMLSQERACGH